MEFMLGCNYWASNAGVDMWRKWDENVIREDLKILSEYNVKYVRIFPVWREFQPVIPCYTNSGKFVQFRLEGDRAPENPYYLDEVMLKRFDTLCDLCEEFGMKVIVGLITGFMSGRLHIPSAFFGKDLFTDPTALLFQQRLVAGIVQRFKHRDVICAWDLGNECRGMGKATDDFVSTNWTGVITNTIRANDATRPVISGLNVMAVDKEEGVWSCDGQAEFVDMVTTHPYPYWMSNKDKNISFRILLHATYENKLYADLSKKDCMVEEIGTVGPMVCSDELTADFARLNMLSNYAHGSTGFLWWCANEQTNLTNIPYTWYMTEIELGMTDAQMKPKPVLLEMKKFGDFMKNKEFDLPKAKDDVVCVLTKNKQQEYVGHMAFCLAKQNDLNLKFCFGENDIPEANAYIVPSIYGDRVMKRESYDYLKDRVYNHGATLCITNDAGILAGFNSLAGVTVQDSGLYAGSGTINLDGEEIKFSRRRTTFMTPDNAEVLACDDKGNPAITSVNYGKGKIFYVNFPLEAMLIDENDAFNTNRYLVYKKIFADVIAKKNVISNNKYVSVTEHTDGDITYICAINYSGDAQKPEFVFNNGEVDKIYRGNLDTIPPCEGTIFSIRKN